MAEVIDVNDISELDAYRGDWHRLLAETPGASFFHTLEWLEAYWRHLGGEQELRVLIVQAAGKAIGIVPLVVRRERYRAASVRVLTYPLDNCGTWYGPIGPQPGTIMLAAMQHIRHSRRDWDMIELRWIPAGDNTVRAMRVAGLFTAKSEYQPTSTLDLSSNWEEFLAGKSHTLRRQFRRTLRQVFEVQQAEHVRHRPASEEHGDGDPRWDLYANCEDVAMASWQSSVVNGNTLTHDRVRAFYRDAHAAAARLGMVDVNVLRIGGQPVAFLYSYHYQGRISALRTGYNAAHGDQGLGSALTLKAIEDSIARGDQQLDFGPGEREHKRRLRSRIEMTYRLTYAPLHSWRSQAVQLSRWAKQRWPRRQETSAVEAAVSA